MELIGWPTFYIILLISTAIILIITAFYILWRLQRVPGAKTGVVLLLASAEWVLGLSLESACSTLPAKLFWSKMQYIGVVIVPTAWLVFTFQFTKREKWLTRRTLLLLSIVPVTTFFLVLTNDYHGLMWSSAEIIADNLELAKTYGIGYWSYIAYVYTSIFIAAALLAHMFIRGRRLYRWQATGLLVVAAFVVVLVSALTVLHLYPLKYFDATGVGVAMAGVVVAWSIVRLQLADIVPVARGTVIDSMSDGILVLDLQNRIVDANPLVQHLIGHSTSELIGKPIKKVWPGEVDQLELPADGTERGKEVVLDTKEGQRTYDVRVSPLTDWRGNLVSQVVVLRDITERKRAEELLHESEEKFRTIFENANDLIVYVDTQGKIVDINNKVEDIFGFKQEEIVGKEFTELSSLGMGNMPKLKRFFREAIKNGKIMPFFELEITHKAGHRIFVEISTKLIEKNGNIEGILGVVRDVTERKRAEEEIKKSLEEKEVLLKEIHHRVKNNMQVISSLLSLQSHYVKDGQYKQMLKESQDRIRSMALIHEKLYESKDLADIDFKEYIKSLAYGLARSYGVSTHTVTFHIRIEDITLGIDTAIPCGLIVNELVANSLKHAFPDRTGEITVGLEVVDGNIELTVSDNGVSIPEDINFRNTETLGLRLVTILAEDQLGGEIYLDRTKGTTFCITFREEIRKGTK
ncbi:MAG: histidine kinase N-terminal 7TM domain-containing protein [Candidatus Methanofastidiosia archaeon]